VRFDITHCATDPDEDDGTVHAQFGTVHGRQVCLRFRFGDLIIYDSFVANFFFSKDHPILQYLGQVRKIRMTIDHWQFQKTADDFNEVRVRMCFRDAVLSDGRPSTHTRRPTPGAQRQVVDTPYHATA